MDLNGNGSLPEADLQLLRDIEQSLLKRGVAVPRQTL